MDNHYTNFFRYDLNIRNNKENINKITISRLRDKFIEYLDMGIECLKLDAVFGDMVQTIYLKLGNQIIVLSGDESFPNKVNEIIFKAEELKWLNE